MSVYRVTTLWGVCAILFLCMWVAPLQATPVAYWTFDNTADDVVGDSDGVLFGTAGYSGNVSTVLSHSTASLDLTANQTVPGDYLGASSAVMVAGSYTLSAWTYSTNIDSVGSFFSSRQPNDASFDAKLSNAVGGTYGIHGDYGNGGSWIDTSADAAVALTANTWNHVAYVVTPTDYKLYWNGSQVATERTASNYPLVMDALHNVTIGAYKNNAGGIGELFQGLIDDVAVYDGALTDAQVASLAAGTSPLAVNVTTPSVRNYGALAYIPIYDDATSQISAEKGYTHKLDFGTGGVATVNGVAFTQGLPNTVQSTYSTNIPNQHAGNNVTSIPDSPAQAVETLFKDMIYGSAEGYITLTGLDPGRAYDARIYVRDWSNPTAADRPSTLEFDTNADGVADRVVTINEDNAMANNRTPQPGLDTVDRAYALSYNFVAESSQMTVRIRALAATGNPTWHLYGVSNETTARMPIDTLFSTGMGDDMIRVDGSTADPHYQVVAGPEVPGLPAYPRPATIAADRSGWAGSSPSSAFVYANTSPWEMAPAGTYTYQTSFELDPHLYNAGTAQVTMTLYADDNVTGLRLNGNPVSLPSAVTFSNAGAITIKLNSGFQMGMNTLEFDVPNGATSSGDASGLRVDLSGTAESASKAYLTADNHWALYIGNAEGTDLRLVGRDITGWETVEELGFVVNPNEYLYVVAWDNPGAVNDPQMWIGEFMLYDGSVLASNGTDWVQMLGPDNANPGAAYTDPVPTPEELAAAIAAGIYGPIGEATTNGAWGTTASRFPQLTNGAMYVWGDTATGNVSESNNHETYYIFRTANPVPEPSSVVLVLLGLLGLVGLRLRNK